MEIDEERSSAGAVDVDAMKVDEVGTEFASAALEEKQEDEKQEEKNVRVGEQATLANVLSAVVFEKLPERLKSGGQTVVKLQIDEEVVRNNEGIDRWDLLLMIWKAYGDREVTFADAQSVLPAAETEVAKFMAHEAASREPDPKVVEALAAAFGQECIGDAVDAVDKFHKFLERCCIVYRARAYEYTSPYVTVSQSSGYGKSRLLYSLAQRVANGLHKSDFSMRVLDVYAHSSGHSLGFPPATTALKEWFFPRKVWIRSEDFLIQRWLTAFHHARKHWSAVGVEWLTLFREKSADATVVRNLDNAGSAQGPQKMQCQDKPVLVFVVDETRALFKTGTDGDTSDFEELRRALVDANSELGSDGCIFGVLVDTNFEIHDVESPPSPNPSPWSDEGPKTSFPPFLLT